MRSQLAIGSDQLRELSDAALRTATLVDEMVGVDEKFVHLLSPAHAKEVPKVLARSFYDP